MFEYKNSVLAVINQKGGVGKTTIAAIIAEYAAVILHKHVILVDLDVQCNSSDYWVGMDPAPNKTGGQEPPKHPMWEPEVGFLERSTIADIFTGQEVMPYETFVSEEAGYKGSVDVLLGHPAKLEEICSAYDNASGLNEVKIVNRLGELLHSDILSEVYDLVIVDTGPSRNPLFRAAMRSATDVVIPFEPEEKSIQGINAMLQARKSENYSRSGVDNHINLVGLLPNKVKTGTNLHDNILATIRDRLPRAALPKDVFLSNLVAFPERDVKGISPRSIFQISEKQKARQQATRVGSYILDSVFNKVSRSGTPLAQEVV